MRAFRSFVTVAAVVVVAVIGCGKSAEGDSCDRGNGNDDCDQGLVCRPAFEVRASESVCCPRPPAKPTTSACQPAITEFDPDPSVDAATSSGGGGNTGGTGGTGGAAGAAGSGGLAGAAGSAGAAGNDAGSDAAADAADDGATDAAGD